MKKKLIVVGAGGHGKVVIDAVLSNENSQYEIKGFLDDGEVEYIQGTKKLGRIEDYKKYIADHRFHIALGNNDLREKLAKEIGTEKLASVFHKTAYIAGDSKIGEGCYIGAMAVINPGTKIGKGTIINTGTIVEHDCCIENFSHLSYRVLMGSGSRTTEKTYIEMGTIINRNAEWGSKN